MFPRLRVGALLAHASRTASCDALAAVGVGGVLATQKRHARRPIPGLKAFELTFLKNARMHLGGLGADTKALIAKRKEVMLRNVAVAREKFKRQIVVVRENIWTLPNVLCLARIAAAPYLGYLIIHEDYQLGLILFGLAGLSDVADGYIARTFASQKTQFGSFLDPLADKVLAACTFLPLAYADLIPWYLAGVIIGRDVCLVAAAFYVRYKSLPPPITLSRFFEASRVTAQLKPTYLSKANTGIQLSLIVATLASHAYGYPDPSYLPYLCHLTLATTVASGIDYAVRSRSTYKLLLPSTSGNSRRTKRNSNSSTN